MTFVMIGVLQLTSAVAAAAVPGRRAARANPLAVLRAE
jgi:ABC-type lipoprotein release transport system permease subunit